MPSKLRVIALTHYCNSGTTVFLDQLSAQEKPKAIYSLVCFSLKLVHFFVVLLVLSERCYEAESCAIMLHTMQRHFMSESDISSMVSMTERDGFRGVDLLLTSEWPKGVENFTTTPVSHYLSQPQLYRDTVSRCLSQPQLYRYANH